MERKMNAVTKRYWCIAPGCKRPVSDISYYCGIHAAGGPEAVQASNEVPLVNPDGTRQTVSIGPPGVIATNSEIVLPPAPDTLYAPAWQSWNTPRQSRAVKPWIRGFVRRSATGTEFIYELLRISPMDIPIIKPPDVVYRYFDNISPAMFFSGPVGEAYVELGMGDARIIRPMEQIEVERIELPTIVSNSRGSNNTAGYNPNITRDAIRDALIRDSAPYLAGPNSSDIMGTAPRFRTQAEGLRDLAWSTNQFMGPWIQTSYEDRAQDAIDQVRSLIDRGSPPGITVTISFSPGRAPLIATNTLADRRPARITASPPIALGCPRGYFND